MRQRKHGLGFIAPTPLGPDWGYGMRLLELAFLPIRIALLPFVLLHRAMDWVAEKWWNS
jgi:hypothetical protein